MSADLLQTLRPTSTPAASQGLMFLLFQQETQLKDPMGSVCHPPDLQSVKRVWESDWKNKTRIGKKKKQPLKFSHCCHAWGMGGGVCVVYTLLWEYMGVYEYTRTFLGACVETNSCQVPSFPLSSLFFETASLTRPGPHCLRFTSWSASRREPTASISPGQGRDYRHTAISSFSYEFPRSDFKCLCFWSKHFTSWAISSGLQREYSLKIVYVHLTMYVWWVCICV